MRVSRLLGTEYHRRRTSLQGEETKTLEPRRPRRRYDRNVELVLGILVIAGFVALLVWLID